MIKLRSRIGPKGQVVIPKPIRETFGFESGQDVYFHVHEKEIILEKKSGEKVLEEFINQFKKKKLPEKIDWDELYYSQFEGDRDKTP